MNKKRRIINKSGEKIEIDPGESVEMFVEIKERRGLTQRFKRILIQGVLK